MTALIDSVILRRLLSLIYLIRVAFCGGRGINLQNDALAGLSDWSSPIIFDRLLDAYRFRLGDELGDGPTIRLLAYLHCQGWQALVGSDLARFRVLQHN
jgi:hypothetical protein